MAWVLICGEWQPWKTLEQREPWVFMPAFHAPFTQFLRSYCLLVRAWLLGEGVRMVPFTLKPFLEFLWDPGVSCPCILMTSEIVVQM